LHFGPLTFTYLQFFSLNLHNSTLSPNFSRFRIWLAPTDFDKVNAHVDSNSHVMSANQRICGQWLKWDVDISCESLFTCALTSSNLMGCQVPTFCKRIKLRGQNFWVKCYACVRIDMHQPKYKILKCYICFQFCHC
jgi:hypothetical protein